MFAKQCLRWNSCYRHSVMHITESTFMPMVHLRYTGAMIWIILIRLRALSGGAHLNIYVCSKNHGTAMLERKPAHKQDVRLCIWCLSSWIITTLILFRTYDQHVIWNYKFDVKFGHLQDVVESHVMSCINIIVQLYGYDCHRYHVADHM